MRSPEHAKHLAARVSHNNCQECRADCERSFVPVQLWHYGHIPEYLAYVKPRLAAIRAGNSTLVARQWLEEYRRALDRRISLKIPSASERKRADGYLDRLRQFRLGDRGYKARYLKQFAASGASTLSR